MTISRRVRFEILRRDGHACKYCGAKAPDVPLTVDHVIPVALGGSDEPANLVTACADCNAGKTSTAPDQSVVEEVDAKALRWASAMRQAAATDRVNREQSEAALREFYDYWCQIFGGDTNLPYDWASSVAIFAKNGLTQEDLEYAINSTATSSVWQMSKMWKYCCGICWRIIKTRQEIALEILEGDD